MSTSIQGRVVASVGLDTFADITDVPLVVPSGIDRAGLLFDGDLTDAQVEAIWWRATSRDADDETCRRNIKALRDAEADTASALLLALADAFLGV